MVDWQALLQGRNDGFSTPIMGARVGSAPTTIPRAIITQLEPSSSGARTDSRLSGPSL